VDTEVAAIKAKTDNLPASPAAVGSAMTLTAAYDAAKSAASQASVDTVDGIVDDIQATVDAMNNVATMVETAMEYDAGYYRFTANALEQAPSGGASAADIADAVLDEALSGHTGAGSLGKAVADVLADTNELQTDLVNGGRIDLLIDAIKAKTDNLPADPADDSDIDSQLATIAGYLDTEIAAILAAVDTEVAAIKAKTDNLPASPAAVGSAMTLTAAYDAAKSAASQASVDIIDDFLDTEIAAILADTNELQTDLVNGGRLDLLIDAIKAKTDNLKSSWNDLSAAQVNVEVDAGLADYDAPTKAELDSGIAGISIPTAVQNRQEMDANSTKLDATISSRAPAATALSTAQWTNVRAALLDYLDVLISSRLAAVGYTAPANSDIAAVKLKTDQLTFTEGTVDANAEVTVDESAIATAVSAALGVSLPGDIDTELSASHGSGQWGAITSGPHSWTDTLVDSFGDPLEACLVEAYSDSDYSTFVTSGKTDANGAITLYFANAGTYYFRASKAGKVSGEKSEVVS
jgi:hypothetical protein